MWLFTILFMIIAIIAKGVFDDTETATYTMLWAILMYLMHMNGDKRK